MRIASRLTMATDSLTIYNIHCFSTTTMVARTRLIVTSCLPFSSCLIPFLYIIFVYQIWNSFHFCGHNLKVGDQRLVLAPKVIINDDRLYPQILGHHRLTWHRSALPANPTSSRPRSWFLGNAALVVAERNGWWRVLGALKPNLRLREHTLTENGRV